MTDGLDLFAGFLMGFFGSIPIAGPVAIVVIAKGLDSNYRGALKVALGAGIGEGLIAGLIFGGLGFASSRFEWLEPVLGFTGVAVLVLLGLWLTVRGVGSGDAPPEGPGEVGGSSLAEFVLGAAMVLGNPGMLATWGGAVAALEGAGFAQASVAGAPFFGVGVCLGVVAWFWLALLAIKRWRTAIEGPWVDRLVRCIGMSLIALGVLAALNSRGGSGV